MAVTRTVKGTLDRLQVSGGSEITFLGPTKYADRGELLRAFRVTPASTGSIIFTLDKSDSVNTIQIFQEDSFNGSASPTGYVPFFNVGKAGKGKGVVAATVTNAAKTYIVMIKFDDYSNAAYNGSVQIP
jgi:hypothetical protein